MKNKTKIVEARLLTGLALTWASAAAEFGLDTEGKVWGESRHFRGISVPSRKNFLWSPGYDWEQGGPIIQREGIELLVNVTETEAAGFVDTSSDWVAIPRSDRCKQEHRCHAPTPLVAAMRSFISLRLGPKVKVPVEILIKG